MLELAKLVQQSIALDEQITTERDIEMTRPHQIENAYVALDVELAEVANTSEWFKVWKTHRGKADAGETPRQTLLTEYTDALDFFLLVAAKKTWTHLIMLTEEDLTGLAQSRPAKDPDQQYLILKRMLFNSHFAHRQDDFRHAWRLFLKWGMVDFGFSQDQIQAAYEAKRQVNLDRQANDY
ncbi:dUTPase [Levilactobacillus namurensis DSM 19117]|uniref:dUTPase n=1 Tax=Levilactobacillus namurensis DSM 19117 TaxID=1423773 RepID=A0A0R1K8Y8_9LACO|nr:dUTPase [Levilactobacillus namurensis]KRK77193.1 dUTPase [Levilactobacillus namurensis DSM 19117]GEO73402.1 2-deoxyuridine 5-triphosphate nucleotidohydrolase [Levilactobacillus namurensis]HJE44738.1 dUTP diphosphatase [Levilactobacillus namurensis]